MVSIITPSYNSERYIAETIESVLAQTYTNWELLITDDCSKDDTIKIVRRYAGKDPRIKLFALEKNVGAASARNVSLDNASGRYIAFLDSDDTWRPDKLRRQLEFMTENGYAFSCSDYSTMNHDGTPTGKTMKMPRSLSYRQYLRNTAIGCLTVVIDRQKTGDFRMPVIKTSHDMALWLLIMRRGFKAYALNEDLASYRLLSTSNSAKKWKAAKDVWRVYRQIENLGVIYSCFNFCGYAANAILKRI